MYKILSFRTENVMESLESERHVVDDSAVVGGGFVVHGPAFKKGLLKVGSTLNIKLAHSCGSNGGSGGRDCFRGQKSTVRTPATNLYLNF